jgi:hypothetical protein
MACHAYLDLLFATEKHMIMHLAGDKRIRTGSHRVVKKEVASPAAYRNAMYRAV